MPRYLVLIAACSATWLATGCQVTESRLEEARSQRGDTVTVVNRVPLRPDTAKLRLLTRYGSRTGTPEETFFRAGPVAVDSEGRVVAFDLGAGLKRFHPDGSFDRWIAQNGEGPGEIGYGIGLAIGPDDAIAVWDMRNRQIPVFDADGTLRSSTRAPDMRPRRGEDALVYGVDGSLWVGVHPLFGSEGRIPLPRPAFFRLSPEGAYSDTIFVPARYSVECPVLSEARQAVGYWEDQRRPFVPKVTWALGSDGSVAYGCPARYTFDVVRPDGSVLRISRSWDPVELTPEEEAQLLTYQGFPTDLPDQRPAYAAILLPEDGRVWVWPNQPMELMALSEELAVRAGRSGSYIVAEHGAFDVFDAEGRWLGSVRLPDALHYSGFPTEPPVFIRGDTVWGVFVDDLDVEYIGRYLVEWTPSDG